MFPLGIPTSMKRNLEDLKKFKYGGPVTGRRPSVPKFQELPSKEEEQTATALNQPATKADVKALTAQIEALQAELTKATRLTMGPFVGGLFTPLIYQRLSAVSIQWFLS